jgi:arsenite-transporting ATPase
VGEIFSSVPGIDEAMSFSQLISSIEKMEFDTIVFDTAPTGHTLRFLNFPNLIEKGLEKIVALKEKFNTLLASVSGIFGSKEDMDAMIDKVFTKL